VSPRARVYSATVVQLFSMIHISSLKKQVISADVWLKAAGNFAVKLSLPYMDAQVHKKNMPRV
jgi:hypothetical protein